MRDVECKVATEIFLRWKPPCIARSKCLAHSPTSKEASTPHGSRGPKQTTSSDESYDQIVYHHVLAAS